MKWKKNGIALASFSTDRVFCSMLQHISEEFEELDLL
jgi:hypothetical protein